MKTASVAFLASILLIQSCKQFPRDNVPMAERFTYDWEFYLDGNHYPHPGELESQVTKVDWKRVDLPHTARLEPLLVNEQWQGICWYRKEFEYRSAWDERQVWLRFEAAMNVAEIWVNGKEAGHHAGGYLPFTLDITEHIFTDRPNSIHVRLDNRDNPLTGPKPLEILDFNMYGGLYRDVKLITKNPLHITDEQLCDRKGGGGVLVFFPEVSKERALVNVRTHLANTGEHHRDLQLTLRLSADGQLLASSRLDSGLEPGTDRELSATLEVKDPQLWSPDKPVLHELEVEVSDGDEIFDFYRTRIGIREFTFKENRLYINGEECFLRGVNRHQEYPYVGYALSDNAQYRDARKIKEAGFDYVRLSHYPQSPAFLDACDELGLVTINPILGWQFYNPDQRFRDQVYADARSLMRRDRNHACVLAWELSLNESAMPHDFIDTLIKIAREEYPDEHCYTAGWMEYGYDIYLQARQHRLGHEAHLPDKPYIVSEYGDWEYYAMNAGLEQDAWADLMPEQRSSRQLLGEDDTRLVQQALNAQEAHNDNFNTPAVADGYWVMFDYNRGYADDLEASGLMSIFRQPKFSYDFFRSQRDPGEEVAGRAVGPVLAIASRLTGEDTGYLKVYSNCEEVELLFNGESQGTQPPDNDRISTNLRHPPFTFSLTDTLPGTVTAIGKDKGREVIRQELVAPGEPYALELVADFSGRPLESGCNDLVFVNVQVCDRLGKPVFNYGEEIRFSLSGDGEIIGNDHPAASGGQASVLVRAGRNPGILRLDAESGGLEAAVLELEVTPGWVAGGNNLFLE